MATNIRSIPSDIFKDIALFLEDEDLGALYLTGDRQITNLMRLSVTKIQYRREMFVDFLHITTIENVWGDGKLLPPNLTTISNFVPFDDDCMDMIPASVTKFGTSCEDGLDYLDKIPKTVTSITLEKMIMDTIYYVFPNNLKHIRIVDLIYRPGAVFGDRSITFPEYIKTIEIYCIDRSIAIDIKSCNLLTYINIPAYYKVISHPNLTTLNCSYLVTSQLSASLESLSICADVSKTLYKQICCLKNLRHLHINRMDIEMAKWIPKSVERLKISILQCGNTKHTISLHEGLLDLELICPPNIELNLPSTLKILYCSKDGFRHLQKSPLPNLEKLYIDLTNANELKIGEYDFGAHPKIVEYDFRAHPKLLMLTTSLCIELQKLPDSIRYLSCAAVSSKGILPKHLQQLILGRSCNLSVKNIKNKLKYCAISVIKMYNDNSEKVASMFKFFELDHLLEDDIISLIMEEMTVIYSTVHGGVNIGMVLNMLLNDAPIDTIINMLPEEIRTPAVIKTITDKINYIRPTDNPSND